MIEIKVKQYLETICPDVAFFIGEKPIQKKSQYVVIRFVFNGKTNHVSEATFSIECYANTLLNAATLHEDVCEAMDGLISIPEVSASKHVGGGQNIDLQTKSYCYETLYDVFFYE